MKVGILGGGQLSRMLALAGYPLGLEFVMYEPTLPCCAQDLSPVMQGRYTDQSALLKFAQQVDVITYENENIPVATLEFLLKTTAVYPGLEALKISQDRLFEKQLFQTLAIPTTVYREIHSKADLQQAAQDLGYPFFLKKRRQGYDGKGQVKIKDPQALAAFDQSEFLQDAIAEQAIAFEREVSLIATRDQNKQICFYDISENVHENGILIRTTNQVNDPYLQKAKEYLTNIMERLAYVGTIAVEFFQIKDQLLANEIAPRVHNSGHWTIEGAFTSQFENHLRAIVGWPLGKTASLGQATMYNIIGTMPDKVQLLVQEGIFLHDYHKEPKPGRKLGHYTQLVVAK